MSLHPPSPFGEHSADDLTPQELLKHLNTIFSEVLSSNAPISVKDEKRTEIISLLRDLCCIMMGEFPKAGLTAWDMLQDRVKIVQVSFRIIDRALVCVENLFDGNNCLERVLLTQFVNLSRILETWIVEGKDDFQSDITPLQLKAELNEVATNTFAFIAGQTRSQPSRDMLKQCLHACLAFISELVNRPGGFTQPFHVMMFKELISSDEVNPTMTEGQFTISVENAIIFDILLLDSLSLVVKTMLSQKVHVITNTYLRQATKLVHTYFFILMDNPYCISVTRRVSSLVKLLLIVEVMFKSTFHDLLSISAALSQLCLMRLRDGPDNLWSEVDDHLQRLLGNYPAELPLCVNVAHLEVCLSEQTCNSESKGLCGIMCCCLMKCIRLAGIKRLLHLQRQISMHSCPRVDETRGAISSHLRALQEPPTNLGKRKRDSPYWQDATWSTIVDKFPYLSLPSKLQTDIQDQQWTELFAAFLDDVSDRIPIETDVQELAQFLDLLIQLACLSADCDGSECSRQVSSDTKIPIRSVIRYCWNSVDRYSKDLSSQLWSKIFVLLTRCIVHTTRLDVEEVKILFLIISAAMKRVERTVRLSAGRLLATTIKFCQDSDPIHIPKLKAFIDQLIQTSFAESSLSFLESMVVSLGRLAKVAKGDFQGYILHLIIKNLGHGNLIIRGIAYNQLLELSVEEKKTPYALLSPYIGYISIALVSDVSKNPDYLVQLCNFLDMTPGKFFNLTLNHFLPHLVCSRNQHALEKVAQELKKSSVSLVTTHEVLARVFLLDGKEDTDLVLKFILNLLMKSRKDAGEPITALMVVKSTVVPLLGELVIHLGENDPVDVKKALQAIIKVAKVLRIQNYTEPASLLGEYLMGVVSHLNEVLQDVHGRKAAATKRKVMRGLGALIKYTGSQTTTVAPQIMATLQSMLPKPDLAEDTLHSWYIFVRTLAPRDIGQYIGPTSAAFLTAWPTLKHSGQELIKRTFHYLLVENIDTINVYSKEFVSLDGIPELEPYATCLRTREDSTDFPEIYLDNLLKRITNDNCTVAELSLLELQRFMENHQEYFLKCASGDNFDHRISKMITTLWDVIYRDGEGLDLLQSRALDCLGRLGAVDPDRLELTYKDSSFILYRNFADEEESIRFALYLIADVLLAYYRSTSDIRFQSHLAFAIQELLKICGFTEALVSAQSQNAIPSKIRARWFNLPQPVLETCAPLLGAKYTRNAIKSPFYNYPIYPSKTTYREWLQDWTASLIDRVTLPSAKAIFNVFRAVVIDKDVGIARCLLPHLVLHILLSGTEDDTCSLEAEISTVLRDQIQVKPDSPGDHRLLCAQTIFMLMDHLNKWIRAVRQDLAQKKNDNKRSRLLDSVQEIENNLVKVDSVLSNINHELVAKAAFECKAFARSLMNFERQIQLRQECGVSLDDKELQSYYERLHEIYSHLDEPDGMEGVTVRVLAPSLEHQIRQHQSTGRLTSAQSCWELQLLQTPDNIESHLGFLRCLRNLGHYDSLQTHTKGVLSRYPDWQDLLSGFQVESAWMVGDWQSVQDLCNRVKSNVPPEIILGRLLLAMRDGNAEVVSDALQTARGQLAAPIHAAGQSSYRRMYETVLNLHLVRDMEIIYTTIINPPTPTVPKDKPKLVFKTLSRRLDSTLPSFRIREPILSLQRITLGLSKNNVDEIKGIIGQAWLSTAKLARKAGHSQTAYSAILQAERISSPFAFLQSCRLIKANGEPIRALQELNNAILKSSLSEKGIIDLTEEPDFETNKLKAKAQISRAQWMFDTERFDMSAVHRGFRDAVHLADNWESTHFHLGKFYDIQSARLVAGTDLYHHIWNFNYQTIKCYARTLEIGSKYVYQTMPRMLTLWLDFGEKISSSSVVNDPAVDANSIFVKANSKVLYAIQSIATYKWLSAFPQIVSRIDHSNKGVFDLLSQLIVRILEEYPRQALWLFMFVVHSKRSDRNRRAESILARLQSSSSPTHIVPRIVKQCRAMTEELLKLCNHQILDEPKAPLSLTKIFPGLARLAPSELIVPLQESMIARLPSESSLETSHKPFPDHLPTIQGFEDGIDVMKSLAKPRKITFRADNGKVFPFLGKPKDDLRKDARLMDFNAMINKLLKMDSNARRRQLRIRTYTVITLNEEAGLIQWVPNTIPMRPVLTRSYEVRNISLWGNKVSHAYLKMKDLPTEELEEFFIREILSLYPPVFHEWFLDTFPEPSAWLASRLSFARTAAVMSMVGFILGLGDRHSENILLDVNTGDVIHVDFDCLFERGKKLETPERVPFRLTQNMQDGLGVTNVDGPFRIASEITMQLLRRNQDCLMSVLDAFIHDPLVEWENEKKRLDKQQKAAAPRRKLPANLLQESVDLRKLATSALLPIKKKLQGIYIPDEADEWRTGKEMTTSNLVDTLIQEAKSNKNLARMYAGWGPFL